MHLVQLSILVDLLSFMVFRSQFLAPVLARVKIMRRARNFDNRGVTAIEYALIAALIAVVIIGAVSNLGKGVSTTFGRVAGEL